ncbi:MAG TPA: DUF4395 domain-containing protein [Epsilonproteobacteria bacterium]|nr:DUF4395 domain-containing protein [Campylobacterota bacterium]
MKKIIEFGESVHGYKLPVVNEREARAGAGILFLFAIISFLNAYLTHRFLFTQIFVTVFMVDFFIRIFINPKLSPSLILGRLFVRHQSPEYVGAVQKRFAWSIGFILSVIMFFIVVVFELMTPVKIAICILCLTFLFSESVFGICIGCTLYHWIYRKSPQYCPGNVCEIKPQEEVQRVSGLQLTVLALSLLIISGFTYDRIRKTDTPSTTAMQCQSGKCSSSKCGGF